MSKLLLIDCDDVLLNWDAYFRDHMKSAHNIVPLGPVSAFREYYDWIEQTPAMCSQLVSEVHARADFATIPAHLDAQTYVPLLAEQGYRFVVVTGCGTEPHVTAARESNINQVFGRFYDDIVYTGRGQSKKDALAKFAKGAVGFVDDLPHNLHTAAEVGLRPIWFQNDGPDHVWVGEKVSNWAQLYQLLK